MPRSFLKAWKEIARDRTRALDSSSNVIKRSMGRNDRLIIYTRADNEPSVLQLQLWLPICDRASARQ